MSTSEKSALAARRQAAEVGPAQDLGAADRRRLEGMPRRAHLVVAGEDARGVADQPDLIDHVVREGIGADADRDAGVHVAADRVHHHAAAREHGRAVRDRRARVAQPLEVVAVRVVDLRMVVEEDAVADHQVGPQHADMPRAIRSASCRAGAPSRRTRRPPGRRGSASGCRAASPPAGPRVKKPSRQVSICAGPTMPPMPAAGMLACAASMVFIALSKAFSPAFSSQA